MTRSFPRVLLGRFAVALAVSFPLVLGGVVGVNVFIDRKIDSIPRVKLKTAQNTDPGEPANFLLIGSDTRAFATSPADQEAYGDPGKEGGQRSDTLMVAHIDPRAKTGFLVSFPRDLLVDIPGIGQSKINAAFNQGPQLVVDTLKQNFDIPIHHYMEVDFASFKGIVDSVGGVAVYLEAPGRDEKSGFDFAPFGFRPGCYFLDGANALGYVRSRDMQELIDGKWQPVGQDAPDLHRIERQQAFMRRLAAVAFRQSVKSPLTANEIADKTIPKLKADAALNRSDINKLITSFRKVDPNDPTSLQMVTLPTGAGPVSQRTGATLQVKQPDADAVLARLRNFGPVPTPENAPKPSAVRVRVFNGSGQNGLATNTATELQRQGFVNVGVGNQPRVSLTEVHYRHGSKDKANVLQSYLGGVGKLIEDKSVVQADVTLVIGNDFKAVTPPPNAAAPEPTAPASSAPAAPAAPAPSTAAGQKGKTPAPPPDPTQC
ncbi:MAG TPA: LCP family protein [Acidimicrobiia bacterium]